MNQASPTWRAVLFDFDGTLADSFPAITASVNHVRSLYNLSPLSVEETRRGVGHGAVHLLQECVGQGSLEANLAAYREHHPSVLRSGTHLLPGVRSTLQLLYERRVKMGVCSNKPLVFTSQLLEILDIARFFPPRSARKASRI